MKRKLLSVSALAMVCMLAFAGCSSSSKTEEKTTDAAKTEGEKRQKEQTY